MQAYSTDLRERVPRDCDDGMRARAVAAKYRVSESWVRRVKQVRRETGRVAPVARRRGPVPGWVAYAARIRGAVRSAPDAARAGYRQRFALPRPRSALARALVALGLSRTNSRSGRRGRTARA